MTLEETQQMFWQVVAERRAVSRSQLDDVFIRPDRLEIYASMYVNRLVDALRAEFPRLAAKLGDDAFFVLAEAYIRKYPSVEPSINAIGRELPRFLRARRQRELARLATLERTRSLVFDARDDVAVGADALAGILQRDLPGVRFEPIAALTLVGRTAVFKRDYVVHDVELSASEARALQSMMRGRRLATICNAFAEENAPVQTAFAAVGSWLASGWIRTLRV